MVNFQKTRKSNFRERERDKFNFSELKLNHGDFIDRSQNEVFADRRSIDRLMSDDQIGDSIMIAQPCLAGSTIIAPTPPTHDPLVGQASREVSKSLKGRVAGPSDPPNLSLSLSLSLPALSDTSKCDHVRFNVDLRLISVNR